MCRVWRFDCFWIMSKDCEYLIFHRARLINKNLGGHLHVLHESFHPATQTQHWGILNTKTGVKTRPLQVEHIENTDPKLLESFQCDFNSDVSLRFSFLHHHLCNTSVKNKATEINHYQTEVHTFDITHVALVWQHCHDLWPEYNILHLSRAAKKSH